jgi:hypothetical protein
MTNFQFLQSEFKPLFEPAKGAEQLVHVGLRECSALAGSCDTRDIAQQAQRCSLSPCRARGEGARRAGEGRSSGRIVAACPSSGATRHLLPAVRGEGTLHRSCERAQRCSLSPCRARGEGARRAGEGRSSGRIVAACPSSGATRHLLPAVRGEGTLHRSCERAQRCSFSPCHARGEGTSHGDGDSRPARLATKTTIMWAFNMPQTA